MIIKYLSDIHFELMRKPQNFFKLIQNPNNAEVFILAGDIGNPCKSYYTEFLTYCSGIFPLTLLVPGNHEYYTNDIRMPLPKFSIPNVIMLNNTITEYKGYTFAGTTLWSDVKTPLNINDVYSIKNMTREYYSNLHLKSLSFIENLPKTKEIVIITHHLPLKELIADKYSDSPYNSWFASDLSGLIKTLPVKHWVYGHTHSPYRGVVNGVNYYCNPVGYKGENNISQSTIEKTFTI